MVEKSDFAHLDKLSKFRKRFNAVHPETPPLQTTLINEFNEEVTHMEYLFTIETEKCLLFIGTP